jgi:hypothetical protein
MRVLLWLVKRMVRRGGDLLSPEMRAMAERQIRISTEQLRGDC